VTKLTTIGSKSLSSLTPLQLYLQEISKYPLLEPEEELELAKRHFDEGDVAAAHRLITSNLRLVVKIANEFRKAQSNLLDLVQEGNYGLMQAVKKYNPYKGVRLSSYGAWWIKAYILKYLLDNNGQVKIATTASQRKLFYNLRKETERLLLEYEKVDSKLLAASLKVPEKDVIEMQKRLASRDVSLDAPLDVDSASTRSDFLTDDQETIEDYLADQQVKVLFSGYLVEFRDSLKGRDQELFDLRLTSEEPLTLQDIGTKFGITRERARQIEARIIEKLKAFVKEKGTLDV
jgi:RNA polymerase sigma-32 factor